MHIKKLSFMENRPSDADFHLVFTKLASQYRKFLGRSHSQNQDFLNQFRDILLIDEKKLNFNDIKNMFEAMEINVYNMFDEIMLNGLKNESKYFCFNLYIFWWYFNGCINECERLLDILISLKGNDIFFLKFNLELILESINNNKNEIKDFFNIINLLKHCNFMSCNGFHNIVILIDVLVMKHKEENVLEMINNIIENNADELKNFDFSLLLLKTKSLIIKFNKESIRLFKNTFIGTSNSHNFMNLVHEIYDGLFLFLFKNSKKIEDNFIISHRCSTKFKSDYIPFEFIESNCESFKDILNDESIQIIDYFSNILEKLSDCIQLDFVGFLSKHLASESVSTNVLVVIYSFLIFLYRNCKCIYSLSTFSQMLLQVVFDVSYNAFDFVFSNHFNFLRSQLIKILINNKDIEILICYINKMSKFTKLINEILLRILNCIHEFDLKLFVNSNFLSLLMDILQKSNSGNNSEIEIHIIFEFLTILLSTTEISEIIYQKKEFMLKFLNFFYKGSIYHKYILNILKSTLNLKHTNSENISTIVEFLTLTNQYYKSDLMMSITLDLYISCLSTNGFFSNFLSSFINEVINFLLINKNQERILQLLEFVRLITKNKKQFLLSSIYFHKLYIVINEANSEIDRKLINKFFQIIANSIKYTKFFIIHNSQFLTLLFLIYPEILLELSELCKFSIQNCVKIHDSKIDIMLLDYLVSENEMVKMDEHLYPIKFKNFDFIKYIYKILSLVIPNKTSYLVIYKLLQLIPKAQTNKYVEKLFLKIIAVLCSKCSKTPQIPLEATSPMIKINKIRWDILNNGFTIDFNLYFDLNTSKNFSHSYEIFKIYESNSHFFRIYLKNGIIFMEYLDGNQSDIQFLNRSLKKSQWNHFTFVMFHTKTNSKFNNFCNMERTPDTITNYIKFDGDVNILFGGTDGSNETIRFGVINSFNFYPSYFSEETVRHMNDPNFNEQNQPIFSTNLFHNAVYEKEDNSLNVEILPSFHLLDNIIEYFMDRRFISLIVNNISYLSIDLLNILSENENKMNSKFKLDFIKILHLKLFNSPDLLNYNFYKSILNLFYSSLKNKKFLYEIFNYIFLNIFLWSKSPKNEFCLILKYWNEIIVNFHGLLTHDNSFETYLLQYNYLFWDSKTKCYELDENRDKLFINFLLKIAQIEFTKNDFEAFFEVIQKTSDKIILLELLELLKSLSSFDTVKQQMTKEKANLYLKIFQNNSIDIFVNGILTLLSIYKNVSNRLLISISFFCYNKSAILQIFGYLLQYFPVYPQIFPILVIFSIRIDAVSSLSKFFKKNDVKKEIVQNKKWYIWLILILLNIEDKECSFISSLISKCLALTKNEKELELILCLIFRMQFLKTNVNLLEMIIINLSEFKLFDNLIEKYCKYFFVIHPNFEKNSKILLDLYNKSPFFENNNQHDYNSQQENSIFGNNSMNFNEFESFLETDAINVEYKCRINISQQMELIDSFYFKIIQKNLKNKNFVSQFQNNETKQISFNLTDFVENTSNEFHKILISNIDNVKKRVLKSIQRARDTVDSLYICSNEFNVRLIEPINNDSLFTRTNCVCNFYCPSKIKPYNLIKNIDNQTLEIKKSHYCIPITMLKFGNVFNSYIYITNTEFKIVNFRKIIEVPYRDIKYFFARKIKNINGFEIYTKQFKAYLFILKPNDFVSFALAIDHFKIEVSSFNEATIIREYTTKWCNGSITNFEYLMKLNILSGRTFNSQYCYPIMPSILSIYDDYNSFPNNKNIKLLPQISISSESFTEESVIAPEFFFDFSISMEHLPKWAESKFEFIYLNRKKLEEIEISNWINAIFGIKITQDNPNIQLFTNKHPKRKNIKDNIPDITFRTKKKINFVLISKQDQTISLNCICDNNIYAVMDLINKDNIQIKEEIELEKNLNIQYSSNYILCYSKKANLIKIININSIKEISIFTDYPIFQIYNDFILYCKDEYTIMKKSISNLSNIILCNLSEKILEIYSSTQFKRLFVLTDDNIISIYDLLSGRFVTKIEIIESHQISNISISLIWGFVLIQLKTRLYLYSINGEFIKSVNFPFIIKRISPSDIDNVDSFVFQTEDNKIGFFEAFYPLNYSIIGNYDCDFIFAKYIPFLKRFVLIDSIGNIYMKPKTC